MEYTIKKDLVHGEFVVYQCPFCQENLESPLKDAGANDTCPMCQKPFKVPGLTELNAKKIAEQAKDEARRAEEIRRVVAKDKINRKNEAEERRMREINEHSQAEKQKLMGNILSAPIQIVITKDLLSR